MERDKAQEPGDGIDRTVIRQLLRLTPAERVKMLIIEARNLDAFDEAVRRSLSKTRR